MPDDYIHDQDIGHDEFNYGLPKLPEATALEFDGIHGVLPFDGVRNPGFRSSTSHTIWLTYKTEANNWQPKVGICESASEGAVSHEALIDPDTFDVRFQPLTVYYELDGEQREYTHDLLIVKKISAVGLYLFATARALRSQKPGERFQQFNRLHHRQLPTT